MNKPPLKYLINEKSQVKNYPLNRPVPQPLFEDEVENYRARFAQLFHANLEALVRTRNPNKGYSFNESNTELLSILVDYILDLKESKLARHKGVLLTGSIGSGKTTIIEAFSKTIASVTVPIRFISALDVFKTDLSKISQGALFIDELGREEEMIKDFGTDKYPMNDLITARYNNNAFTLATSNFKLDTLSKKYGNYVGDRLKEMFNLLELTGKSWRI